jgi:hypothetical protein
MTSRLGHGNRVILSQRVQGSVRAVRAVRNTQVFQTENRVVADALMLGMCFATYIQMNEHCRDCD